MPRLITGAPAALIWLTLAFGPASVHAQEIEAARTSAGASIYAKECASCHGADLEGQANWRGANEDGTLPAPPHDATGHSWHHPDSLLLDYVALGGEEALRRQGVTGFKSAMPGFGDRLSDREIRQVLAYIKSFWPNDALAYQAERTREQ